MFFVYVLYSDAASKHYVGQTNDLSRRLIEHNDPTRLKHKYTAKWAGTWVFVHQEQYSTRAEAMAREKWLKTGAGRSWLKQLLSRQSRPPMAD